MAFMFIIDYPIRWGKKLAGAPSSIADWVAMTLSGQDWGLASVYTEDGFISPVSWKTDSPRTTGSRPTPARIRSLTLLGIELSPTLLAIGWFMKFRVAFLVNLGSIVAWFFLVPLVVIQDVPVYDPSLGSYVSITQYSDPSSGIFNPTIQWKAFSSVVRTIAIGAILGGECSD